jgi:hypothetical protein
VELVIALVVVLLLAVVVAVVVRRSRRTDPAGPQLPDGPLQRDAAAGEADARGAVNRNSWMLGGGGTGG